MRKASRSSKYQSKKSEVQFFDSWAASGGYIENAESEYQDIYDQLLESVPLPSRVLDVGCGAGSNSVRLAERGFNVVGVDISALAIQVAGQRSSSAEYVVCDAEHLPFTDGAFDVAFCGAVLHHFPDLSQVATELERVLPPGGLVASYDPNALHPYEFLIQNVSKAFVVLPIHSPNERAITPSHLQRAFGPRGFDSFQFGTAVAFSKKPSYFVRMIKPLLFKMLHYLLPGLSKGNMLLMRCRKQSTTGRGASALD